MNKDYIIIENLLLNMSLGIYDHEKAKPQPVVLDIKIEVQQAADLSCVTIKDLISYEDVVTRIKSLCASRHYDLIEVLCEEIAVICLSYAQALNVSIKALKPTIIPDCAVGITIYRTK